LAAIRKKIIVVDDNASYLFIVRNLLKSFYDVYPAPSGRKLFSLMERFIPDMILLDINMPGMSGYEVIKTMKENPRFKDIPVVFFTARDDEDSAVEGLNLGAVDYVTKPFSGPLLLRRISNLLLIEELRRELQISNSALADLKAYIKFQEE